MNYPNAAGWTYIIEMFTTTTITITFTAFDLRQYDVLYYGRGNSTQSMGRAVFSNSMALPASFQLSTDSFWFRFVSDISGTDAGFSVQWAETCKFLVYLNAFIAIQKLIT